MRIEKRFLGHIDMAFRYSHAGGKLSAGSLEQPHFLIGECTLDRSGSVLAVNRKDFYMKGKLAAIRRTIYLDAISQPTSSRE
jgi:hypothetical protein